MTLAAAQKEIIEVVSNIKDMATLETVNFYLKNRIVPNSLNANQIEILRKSDVQVDAGEVIENADLFNNVEAWLERK